MKPLPLFDEGIRIGVLDPFFVLGPNLGSDLCATNSIKQNNPPQAAGQAVILRGDSGHHISFLLVVRDAVVFCFRDKSYIW